MYMMLGLKGFLTLLIPDIAANRAKDIKAKEKMQHYMNGPLFF